jgi:hypothetical protein
MAYLGFKYVGLDRVLLGTGYDVAADFKDSGGIFVNAEVTYRGVAVGRVSDMKLTDDGVRVVLTINPDAKPIPADADAVVANRSAVGEQYVDLRPEDDKGPFLEDGSVIPQSRTSIPIPVEQLLLDVDQLVGSLNIDDLRTVVDELGKAFAGSGDDLTRLIDNGDPRACTSGYVSTGQTPSPDAVASVDTSGIQCQVVNGVDPNPGDGIDESGSDIRGSQNIGGSGGVGSPGPTGAVTGGANPLSPLTDAVNQLLGSLLSANPIASSIG